MIDPLNEYDSTSLSGRPPGRFKIWWLTLRPATLWAGAAPVFVGSALAARHGHFSLISAICALLGALLIQVGCNLVNDYSDFEKGADDQERLGPARAAAQGWLTVDELKRGAMISLGLAGLVGVYLTWVGGWPILMLGLASLLCAVAYTAGPFPLAYLGLGDMFVMIFFGFGAVGGTYYVHAQALHPYLIPVSWAVGALATAILAVNNLRDRVGDAKVGKRTLAVRYGRQAVRIEYISLILSAFLCVGLTAFFEWRSASSLNSATVISDVQFPWEWLSPLLLTPIAGSHILKVCRLDGADLNPLLGETAKLELLFCLLLSGGLLC
jgi:1,4-dihydroxy-2-naphthoate polyprenyltransferase